MCRNLPFSLRFLDVTDGVATDLDGLGRMI